MTTIVYRFHGGIGLLRKGCVTAVCLFLAAVVPGCGSASEAYIPLPPSQSIPMDGTTYEWIGRQALAQYGYEEIIKRGVEAGFLRYPDSEQTNTQNLVGQTMADAAREARPVFTKWAVMALLTSQMDSPAPGPADAIALGMLVVAIGSAAFVGVTVLTSSTTATAPPTTTPIPTATATTTTTSPPIAVPTTTTTSPPIALPRKYPNQTCENKRLDALQAAMKAVCKGFPGEPCKPQKSNAERLPLLACSVIKARIAAVSVCSAARQKVQDECFKGAPEPGHEQQIEDLTRGITWCDALKLVNCAPGHPMSGL